MSLSRDRTRTAFVALLMAGATLIGGAGRPALADTSDQLVTARTALDAVMARIAEATGERDSLQVRLEGLFTTIDADRRTIEGTEAQVVDAQQQIADVAAQLAAQQAAVDERAVEAFTIGPGGGLEVVLGASSVQDLQDRIRFIGAAAATDRALVADLSRRRDDLAVELAGLEDLQARQQIAGERVAAAAVELGDALTRQAAVVDGLQRDRADATSLVRQLRDRRQREVAAAALRNAVAANGVIPAAWPWPTVPQPGAGSATVPDLIIRYFTPLGPSNLQMALCVGYRESGYQPSATNPNSSSAGVFQFMPAVWPPLSQAAGWGAMSVYDGEANVAVAAWTVAHYGWSPWRSDSGICGI